MTQHTITDEQLKKLREAIEQVLDDGDYINDKGEIYAAPDRKTGGCFCHDAGLQLIEALSLLDTIEKQTESAEGTDIKPELDFIDYLIDQWIVMKEKYTYDYFRYCQVFHEQAVALRSRHVTPQKKGNPHE